MSETTIPADARSLARPLEALMLYEHHRLIRRFMEDHHVTERTAQARFNGFKQFIAVCGMMDGDKITSDVIDTMWHTFLLFTRDYEQFCTQYLGEYIHHEPFEMPNPGAYLKTRRFAEQLFGPLDRTLWPVNAKGHCSSGACRGGDK